MKFSPKISQEVEELENEAEHRKGLARYLSIEEQFEAKKLRVMGRSSFYDIDIDQSELPSNFLANKRIKNNARIVKIEMLLSEIKNKIESFKREEG